MPAREYAPPRIQAADFGHVELVPDPRPRPDGRRLSDCTIADVWDAVEEGGRTYQGYMPGGYSLPVDGEEQDRLDMSHHCFKLLFDGHLSVVPFEKPPRNVLDLATGTGIWAIEFAEQNPYSRVTGVDISAIQPVPRAPNCEFRLNDAEREAWWWCQEPLDLIHMRSVGPCFQDFGAVLRTCHRHTRPGGWIELQDTVWEPQCVDDTMAGTSIAEFFGRIAAGAAALGHDFLKTKRFREHLHRAGYVDVQEVTFSVGASPWPRDAKMRHIGHYVASLLLAAMEGYTKILRASGLEEHELEDLKARFTADVKRTDIHWYMPVHVVIGRKPYDAPAPYPETPYGLDHGTDGPGTYMHNWA